MNGIVVKYRGIPIYTVPDEKIEQIIIPQSMMKMLIDYEKLQEENYNLKFDLIFNTVRRK